jgi:hypothetical protein
MKAVVVLVDNLMVTLDFQHILVHIVHILDRYIRVRNDM